MYKTFSQLLYSKMTHAREDRWKREHLAEALTELGRPTKPEALYRYGQDAASGGINCPPEVAMLIYCVTEDPDVLNYLVCEVAGALWHRPPDIDIDEVIPAKLAADSSKEHAEAVIAYLSGCEDGVMTEDEYSQIAREIFEVIRLQYTILDRARQAYRRSLHLKEE